MVLICLGFAVKATAQSPEDLHEGLRLEKVSEFEHKISWWGKAGRTYFVEASEDLFHWTYLPLIEFGAHSPIEWGFTCSESAYFFRLRYTDADAGGNVLTADFDGDGVPNLQELQNGFDPLDGSSRPTTTPLFQDLPSGSPRLLPYFSDYAALENQLRLQFKLESSSCLLVEYDPLYPGGQIYYRQINFELGVESHRFGPANTPYGEQFIFDSATANTTPFWAISPLNLATVSNTARVDVADPDSGSWQHRREVISSETILRLAAPIVDARTSPPQFLSGCQTVCTIQSGWITL